MPEDELNTGHAEPLGDEDFAVVHVDDVWNAALKNGLAEAVFQDGKILVKVELSMGNQSRGISEESNSVSPTALLRITWVRYEWPLLKVYLPELVAVLLLEAPKAALGGLRAP